jgi:ubiquinone/menaquinone biosynthesis C-methylase UbiE
VPEAPADSVPAPQGVPRDKSRSVRDGEQWFREHYDDAAQQVIDFLAGDGVVLDGKDVADLGCGDGIIDLGVSHKANPSSLIGFDLLPVDTGRLVRLAQAMGVRSDLPGALRFQQSGPTSIPAPDDSFDVMFTWSTFEHVIRPVEMATEIARVLRPDGYLMLQLWPFYDSEHGSHLWEWFPEGFVQHGSMVQAVEAEVRAEPHPEPAWVEERLEEFRTLNRITLDELQNALMAGGLRILRLELITHTIHIPRWAAHIPLSRIGVAGVKLLALHA